MTNEQIQFFAEQSDPCAVFGRGENFILLPVGTGELPSLEIIVDGVTRGFTLCGYVGLCRDCADVAMCFNPEVPDAAFTVQLARSRYAAWLRNRDKAVNELTALYTLPDPRQIV